ncbi:MAG: methionine--tRNA ligase, partial [Proteobacteria bacterium]|nr:methionine--tRNA ligase [Pseudomonadota bacterium]
MGHAYSSISADVIARYKRLEGYDVKFLTGTDEHGQKIQKSAIKENLSPIDFCNKISKVFLDLTKQLNLSNTDFIRTTETRHVETVQKLWKILEKNNKIYLSKYSGWYSVSDEAYYSEEEIENLENGKKICRVTGSIVEWVEEESFFFKLSEFQQPLLTFYEKNPNFIQPESRKNEVISFVKSGLKDLSISRT